MRGVFSGVRFEWASVSSRTQLCLYIQIRMYCIVDALQIVLRDLEYICSASLEWG